MGTMRMGDDPTASVCDRFGKLHDLGNLWCADAGLFPTSSGFNPTLTLQTVALWVANITEAPRIDDRARRVPASDHSTRAGHEGCWRDADLADALN